VTYNDNYPRSLMLCQEHTESVFRTFNRLGDITFWRGTYLITDGGYPTYYSFLNSNLLITIITPSYGANGWSLYVKT
jgi:hypothetical protein